MTDIVERTPMEVMELALREAANENERLRAAIAYMDEHADSPIIIRREARRALEQKP